MMGIASWSHIETWKIVSIDIIFREHVQHEQVHFLPLARGYDYHVLEEFEFPAEPEMISCHFIEWPIDQLFDEKEWREKELKARELGVRELSEASESHRIKPKKKKTKKKIEAVQPVIPHVTTINHLPLDCLSYIFSFLSLRDLLQLPAVCKCWRDLESNVWRDVKKLDLISFEKSMNPKSFTRTGGEIDKKNMHLRFTTVYPKLLSLSGKFLRVLTLPVPERFDILPIATDECQNLRKIVIRFENFQYKARCCQELERLFVKNKNTLRSVVIDNVGKVFDSYNECLLQLPEELIELQLFGYKARYSRFSEREVMMSLFYDFAPAIQRLKKLQILVLNGMRVPPDEISVIENFDDLRYLELYRSSPFSFDIKPISSRRKLEYLSLERVSNMDNRWFADLVENNPNLKHLKLQACPLMPEFILQLFALSKLETLSLIKVSLPKFIDLSGFPNLKKFVCSYIGDRAIIGLMKTALDLKVINLKQSRANTGAVLDKAHAVTRKRTNNVPLHVIVADSVLNHWRKPERISPLLTVESCSDYNKRTRSGYEDNEEELFY